MTIWRRRLLPVVLACIAVAVVWWSVVQGRAEQRTNTRLNLGAAPLVALRMELGGRRSVGTAGCRRLQQRLVVACSTTLGVAGDVARSDVVRHIAGVERWR